MKSLSPMCRILSAAAWLAALAAFAALPSRAAYAADPGHQGWYITPCLLAAADRTGGHLLVSCDRFGRLDRGRFTPLPGAAPQAAISAAW